MRPLLRPSDDNAYQLHEEDNARSPTRFRHCPPQESERVGTYYTRGRPVKEANAVASARSKGVLKSIATEAVHGGATLLVAVTGMSSVADSKRW